MGGVGVERKMGKGGGECWRNHLMFQKCHATTPSGTRSSLTCPHPACPPGGRSGGAVRTCPLRWRRPGALVSPAWPADPLLMPVIGEDLKEARNSDGGKLTGLRVRNALSLCVSAGPHWLMLRSLPLNKPKSSVPTSTCKQESESLSECCPRPQTPDNTQEEPDPTHGPGR